MARWARAQGHNVDIADHPDAETAVHRGRQRRLDPLQHLMRAVMHLLNDNPCPETVSFDNHAMAIVGRVAGHVRVHREQILANLKPFQRGWNNVLGYMPDNQLDWALWLLNHPSTLRRKTIRLIKDEVLHKPEPEITLDRVGSVSPIRIERAREDAVERARYVQAMRDADEDGVYDAEKRRAYYFPQNGNYPEEQVTLLTAPTGSGRSTRNTRQCRSLRRREQGQDGRHPDAKASSRRRTDRGIRRGFPNASAAVWRRAGSHREVSEG